MAWHTLFTKTTTIPSCWYYHVHIVAPLALILNYQLNNLYLLEKEYSKKPPNRCDKPRNRSASLHACQRNLARRRKNKMNRKLPFTKKA